MSDAIASMCWVGRGMASGGVTRSRARSSRKAAACGAVSSPMLTPRARAWAMMRSSTSVMFMTQRTS